MPLGRDLINQHVNVVSQDGGKINVIKLLSGEGGQGDVWLAEYHGQHYALKWYCKNPADVIGGDQYKSISRICGEGKKPSDSFIWPEVMAVEGSGADGSQFGYLMKLLPDGFYEMQDFLRMDGDPQSKRFTSYAVLLAAGINIASCMQKLHLKGWTYKDLNPKNFMFNPNTGEVLVVDNDNVSADGDPCSVLGMKGYMAPEITRTQFKTVPSRSTDYYSLGIVLYRLFYVDHPMEGKAWEKYPMCTDKVEDYLYSVKPIFHFHPTDKSNIPTDVYAPNARIRWNALPGDLRTVFTQLFTDGIDAPAKRPTEQAWIDTIFRAREKLIKTRIGEQFVSLDDKRTVPPMCLGLNITRTNAKPRIVALYPMKAIYEFSLDGDAKNTSQVAGGISYDQNNKRLTIVNLTDKIWKCWDPETQQITNLGKKQQFPIKKGVAIEFNHEKPQILGEVVDLV